MPEQDLRAILPGASALIKALCDELQMAQVIDGRPVGPPAVQALPGHPHRPPGGQRPGAPGAPVPGGGLPRRPGCGAAVRARAQAGDLNDDALARALDALAEANPSAIFSQIALNAVLQDGNERLGVSRPTAFVEAKALR